MRTLLKSALGVLAALALAGCGGGGGGGSDAGFQPIGLSVNVTTGSAATTPNSLVDVTVRVNRDGGNPATDGTPVTLIASPASVGLVSSRTPNPVVAESVTATTSGGVANFRFHSRAVGTATLTASVVDPNAPQSTQTGTAQISVAAGAPNDPRIRITATVSTLPINPGVPIFFGSPYISELRYEVRDLNGNLITDPEACVAAISPTTVAAFSTLDDPDTDDINEFFVLLGSGPVVTNAGIGTIYVHSSNIGGTATVNVSCRDPLTGEAISGTFTFTVSGGVPQVPAAVVIIAEEGPVFIQGVNGDTNAALQIFVRDAAGTLVPDPPAGASNVRLEIVGGAQGGERLSGVAGNGAPQQGGVINIRTAGGIAGAAYQSGTRSGTVTLRATIDRADNNVDNGIQDPQTSTRTIEVSDGRLREIEIEPSLGGTDEDTTFNDGTGLYQSVISAVTNGFDPPPAPGTVIRWGLVDEPQTAGTFRLRGSDGNPQEGGTLFTAATGRFDLARGPGDTLLILAREPDAGTPDNRDLEGARFIAQIQSPTQLQVTYRFNHNENTQGVPVDNGPVLDYVIGHPADANIVGARRVVTIDPETDEPVVTFVSTGGPNAETDEFGRVYAIITYPRTVLGKPFYVWAQGNGAIVNGTPEVIGDVELTSFVGAGPTTLVVSPAAIFPNREQTVQVCARDATGAALPGVQISYSFNIPGGGTVIGQDDTGIVAQPTGANGCTTLRVRANSLGAGGELVFTVVGDPEATATVEIQDAGTAAVTATPNPVFLAPNTPAQNTGATQVCVLTESGGVQGVPIALVNCTGPNPPTAGTAPMVPPTFGGFAGGTTDGSGCTVVGVTYQNLAANQTFVCTYSAGAAGSIAVTYRVP